jgi:hypothetical protein
VLLREGIRLQEESPQTGKAHGVCIRRHSVTTSQAVFERLVGQGYRGCLTAAKVRMAAHGLATSQLDQCTCIPTNPRNLSMQNLG